MKKLLFSILALSATGVYAQDVDLKINNLQVFGRYNTAEEIFDALGEKPTKIHTPQPTDEAPDTYIFFFGEDMVVWSEGEIFNVVLNSGKFAVNGTIRVGDKISDLKKLGGYIDTSVYEDIVCWYPSNDLAKYEWVQVWFHHSKDGIITTVSALILDV